MYTSNSFTSLLTAILLIGTTQYSTDAALVRTCGDVLNVRFGIEGTGYVNYKSGETYNAQENCIWTIRSNESVAFDMTFDLLSSGVADVDSLQLYSFDLNKWPLNTTSASLSLDKIEHGYGPVALVHFKSRTNLGTGFHLRVVLTTPRYYLETYQDLNTHTDSGSLDPYASTGSYGNNELSSFVINNSNTSLSTPIVLKTNIDNLYNCMGGCCDRIHFYKIEENGLEFISSPCYARNMTVSITSVGPKIVFFESDSVVTSSGFTLEWYPEI